MAELPTPGAPVQLLPRPNSDQMLLLSEEAITRIDPETWKPIDTIDLPVKASHMALSGDGRRAFVAAAKKGQCAVIDLEQGKLVTEVGSGRDSVKVGKTAAITAFNVLAILAGGNPIGGESARPTVALTHDDRHLLVLNQRTNDVTILDATDLTVKKKISTGKGSYALLSSQSGEYHYVLADNHLAVIPSADPAATQKYEIKQQGDRLIVFVDENRGELWIPSKSTLEVFHLATGEPKATVEGVPRPSFILTSLEAGLEPTYTVLDTPIFW